MFIALFPITGGAVFCFVLSPIQCKKNVASIEFNKPDNKKYFVGQYIQRKVNSYLFNNVKHVHVLYIFVIIQHSSH